ncbi:MAG: preprotein translocase subunit SecE [Bacteroidota bacterium]
MEKLRLYIKESYNELLNKVTWPTWSELQSNTILVLVASIIIALIILLMDNVSSILLQNLVYGTGN